MRWQELFKPKDKIEFDWEQVGQRGWNLWHHGGPRNRMTVLIQFRFLEGNKDKVYIEADLEGRIEKADRIKISSYFLEVMVDGIRQFLDNPTIHKPKTIMFSASGKGRNKLYNTMISRNLIDNYKLDKSRELNKQHNMYILKRIQPEDTLALPQ